MLTPEQTANTMNELRENHRRLGEAEESVLKDLRISADELHAVLDMNHPNPSNV